MFLSKEVKFRGPRTAVRTILKSSFGTGLLAAILLSIVTALTVVAYNGLEIANTYNNYETTGPFMVAARIALIVAAVLACIVAGFLPILRIGYKRGLRRAVWAFLIETLIIVIAASILVANQYFPDRSHYTDYMSNCGANGLCDNLLNK